MKEALKGSVTKVTCGIKGFAFIVRQLSTLVDLRQKWEKEVGALLKADLRRLRNGPAVTVLIPFEEGILQTLLLFSMNLLIVLQHFRC